MHAGYNLVHLLGRHRNANHLEVPGQRDRDQPLFYLEVLRAAGVGIATNQIEAAPGEHGASVGQTHRMLAMQAFAIDEPVPARALLRWSIVDGQRLVG